MAYTAWSVVFGEQPTAAKWNQLGANDAGFKDMTNMDDSVILTRHMTEAVHKLRRQDNVSNALVSGYRIQTGWGYLTGTGANTRETETVTFPVAFSSAPIVICSYAGASGSVPATIVDLSSEGGSTSRRQAGAVAITASNFKAMIVDDGNVAAIYYGYSWIAIGAA